MSRRLALRRPARGRKPGALGAAVSRASEAPIFDGRILVQRALISGTVMYRAANSAVSRVVGRTNEQIGTPVAKCAANQSVVGRIRREGSAPVWARASGAWAKGPPSAAEALVFQGIV
jgi:hypothetical protein